MLAKKGFWVLIVLLLATNAMAISFSYTIIQKAEGDIPKNSGNTLDTTCNPLDPENVQLRLPFAAQKIRAQACNNVPGSTSYYRSAGIQICTSTTNCAELAYSGSHKGTGLLCSPWTEASGNTIRTCAGNERASAGRYYVFIYTQKNTNVTRTEIKSLGSAPTLAAPYVANQGDTFTVESGNNKVHMWIDVNNEVFACYDSDSDTQCDVDQAQACSQYGWDWNSMWYLPGMKPADPGTVPQNMLSYCEQNPEEFYCTIRDYKPAEPQPQPSGSLCCGGSPYDASPCKYYSELNAVCGKNAQNEWKWISAGNLGQARQLSCPTPIAFLIAQSTQNPRQYWFCGNMTNAVSATLEGNMQYQAYPPQNKLIVQSLENVVHEFLCLPNEAKIIECTENGDVLNEGNLYKEAGEWMNQTGIQFCTGNRWVTDLDDWNNRKACIAASQKNTWQGIAWTGRKCCGDPETTPETYVDPWQDYNEGTSGGCYNSTFIPSGGFVDPEHKIINYKGQFWTCDWLKAAQYFPKDTNSYVKNQGVCGTPLLNATLVGTKHHIVCTPDGVWMFTNNTANTTATSTTWSTSKGCCLPNQCWDGDKCRNIGETYPTVGEAYRTGDRGYKCVS